MTTNANYGQYCPLSMAAEFLCNRWTLLLIREMLFGSTSFNDICRGLPLASRTLLSNRLKELIQKEIVTKSKNTDTGQTQYLLTEAGLELGAVIKAMASWGQEWLQTEPALAEIDESLLMWDIRRNAKPLAILPDPFIVHFHLNDIAENRANHWLIYENDEVDLCYIDHDFNIDVVIDVSVKKLVKIWMGWDVYDAAINDSSLIVEGSKKYVDITKVWLGQSSIAHVKKHPENKRINA